MERSRIQVLAPDVARRIAAGEVIDRPAAAIRELLDNAIDSGAQTITVELTGGGIESLRVVDNGSGMVRSDLELSILPHATSKISSIDDLLSLGTLGFRGEALSSMAAVADIQIVSSTGEGPAWKLTAGPGVKMDMAMSHGPKGTSVTLRSLFANFPARRQFLKRPAAEAAACKAVVLEKAMAFPAIAFRMTSDGRQSVALVPGSLEERVLAAAIPGQPAEFFRGLVASGNGFSARLVAGTPDVYRNDRRLIQVFVNGRRVQEYAIAQALEYSYRGWLPGGAWPVVCAFIDVDPAMADFNIHPAKKEVRLKNVDDIRGGVIGAIRDWLAGRQRLAGGYRASGHSDGMIHSGIVYHNEHETWSAMADAIAEARQASSSGTQRVYDNVTTPLAAPVPSPDTAAGATIAASCETVQAGGYGGERPEVMPDPERIRYVGQVLGVFIVFEYGDDLVIMDQHAAHERHLYNQILSGSVVSQEMLVPVVYEPSSDEEDRYLAVNAPRLESAGFVFERQEGTWLLTHAPAMLPESRTGSIFEVIRSMPDPDALIRSTAAQAACKAAIKDGDSLDEIGALSLIRAALALPEPRCPHGRPIWVRMSRTDLFKAVRRLV